MAPLLSKVYLNNIRINLFEPILSDDRTTANAHRHILSTDNPDEVLPNIYNYLQSLMKEFGGCQIDFVMNIRISGTKHREYFEDGQAQLDRQNRLNKEHLARKRASDPNYKPKQKPTYQYKQGYGPKGVKLPKEPK